MSRNNSVSPVSSMPAHKNRRPHRASRPWQLVVAELATNAGRGVSGAKATRCGCPLCSGPVE